MHEDPPARPIDATALTLALAVIAQATAHQLEDHGAGTREEFANRLDSAAEIAAEPVTAMLKAFAAGIRQREPIGTPPGLRLV